jgi:SAM-dependent methyltransferase
MQTGSTSSTASWAPDLRRSVRLLGEFRHEQTDPNRFYSAIAEDSVGQLSTYLDLAGRTVLDVGGGPGYFRTAFRAAGADYWALDADVGELSGAGRIEPGTVVGDGMNLPFRDGSVDLCYSSNVLEHVPDPWRMAEEMLRVTRPGGIAFISYTVWYRALALPRWAAGPAAVRRPPRPRAEEQVRRVAVPGDRPGGAGVGEASDRRRGGRRAAALPPALGALGAARAGCP